MIKSTENKKVETPKEKIIPYVSSGNTVKKLQKALTEKGYYNGKIDGVCGNITVTAMMKFQKDNGLYADGFWGKDCWDLL